METTTQKLEIDYDLLAAKVAAHVCDNLKDSGYLARTNENTIRGVTQDEPPAPIPNGTLIKQRPAEKTHARR